MTPAEYLSRALKSLTVPPETLGLASKAAEEAGLTMSDSGAKLYKEWVNDILCLPGADTVRNAAKDPSRSFLDWVRERLDDPWNISRRTLTAAVRKHGPDTALLFAFVRWRQETAWAKRMRGSDNDRVALLADIWLKAALHDPARMFHAVMDVYVGHAAFDPAYASSPYHEWEAHRIVEGSDDGSSWNPLWLRHAEATFGSAVNQMPRVRLEAAARQARTREACERLDGLRQRRAAQFLSSRPALMASVVSSAVEAGVTSDELCAAEADIAGKIRSGDIDPVTCPIAPWRMLADSLPAWVGTVPAPPPEEHERRTEEIRMLSPAWADSLSQPFLLMGASRTPNIVAWFNAIDKERTRPAPLNPKVDYCMWLMENRSLD